MAVGDRFEHELVRVKLLEAPPGGGRNRQKPFQVHWPRSVYQCWFYTTTLLSLSDRLESIPLYLDGRVVKPLESNDLFSQMFVWTPRKQLFIEITQKSDIIPSAG